MLLQCDSGGHVRDVLDERRDGAVAVFRWCSSNEHHREYVGGV